MAKKDLSNAKKKEWAEQLFLQDQHTQKEICVTVDVSEQTMSKWVKDGLWEQKRKSMMTTTAEIIRDLKDTLAEMRKEARLAATDGDPSTKPDTDGIYKMTLAIKNLENKSGIGETILIVQALIKFIQQEDGVLAKELTKWGDLFIKSRLKAN